jgi:hypothetical protein
VSTVPLWEVNPYWLSLNRLLVYMWNNIVVLAVKFSHHIRC